MQPITTIYLYDEPDAAGLDVAEIGGYLVSQFPGVEALPRSDFFSYQFARFTTEQRAQLEPEVVRQLQCAQVSGSHQAGAADPHTADLGPVLDATAFQTILRLLLDPQERGPEHLHIIFTEQAIGSWHEQEQFDLQVIALGEPTIISITGLVEALPRPKEYQFRRAQLVIFGADEDALEDLAEEFASRAFGYADPRINEVCKGYALMACFHAIFGETHCDDPCCRLYDVRTQDELIAAQCGERVGLCERHERMRRGWSR